MSARIVGATLRDLSYIAANLRPEDRTELDCQFDEWTPASLASWSLRDHSYVVEIDGNPEAAFGANRSIHRASWIAWSWGTRRMWRAVPRITAFVRDVMLPEIIGQGGWRCEARALASHHAAHRWLKRMGAHGPEPIPRWGRNGEDFVLFYWVRDDHVFQPARVSDAENRLGSNAESTDHSPDRLGCREAA